MCHLFFIIDALLKFLLIFIFKLKNMLIKLFAVCILLNSIEFIIFKDLKFYINANIIFLTLKTKQTVVLWLVNVVSSFV